MPSAASAAVACKPSRKLCQRSQKSQTETLGVRSACSKSQSRSCRKKAACSTRAPSNAVKRAIHAARAAIEDRGALPVPKKLRNAVTRLMKDEGYGQGYQYPPEREGSYVPGETYLPDELVGTRFYEPTSQGLEKAI